MLTVHPWECPKCERKYAIKQLVCTMCQHEEPLQDDTRSFNGYYASNPENNGRRDGY